MRNLEKEGYGNAYGTLPTPTRTGYTFVGWYTAKSGGTKVSSTTTMGEGNLTVYAQWSVNSYTVSWNAGTGYNIKVVRTSSPEAGASTGPLSNGATVYYGDVISIDYSASSGYGLTGIGVECVTVSGNVTSSSIWATAVAQSYTYNVVYKSSNGTALGSTTVTYDYGTTNTITAPTISGYTTPSSQNVKWDSTSAKTITFTYLPTAVANTLKSGNFISSRPKITYSTTVSYRNRTATSVEVLFTTVVQIQSGWNGFQHGIAYKATCGSVVSGVVQVAPYYSLQTAGSSSSATSGWISVPLNTTNATSVSFNVYMYQNNLNGTDLSAGYGYDSNNYTWTVNIPAY